MAAALENETDTKNSLPQELYQNFWIDPRFVPGVKALQEEFEPRPDDIFLASLTKTGTTWGKALLRTIVSLCHACPNPLPDDEKSPNASVPNLELELFNSIKQHDVSIFSELPSPRVLHTHLPFHGLPTLVRSCSSDCKIVYITRNPRDTFVSLCKFYDKLRQDGWPAPVETLLFDGFCSGSLIHCGPFAEHVLGYWRESKSNPNKVMFVTYEDLQADCVGWVKKLGIFMGCSPRLVEENAERVVQICSFDSLSNMEGNKSGIALENTLRMRNAHLFRKGKVGDWKKYFTPEMEERIYRDIEQKLNNEDIHLTY